jgi:hypothetical protein
VDVDVRDTVVVERKGEALGVILAKTKQITGKTVSLDTTARTVIIEGPRGGTQTIKAAPEAKLDGIQKGDDVTLRVIAGLAIRVEKP